jgi:hypothetical protein
MLATANRIDQATLDRREVIQSQVAHPSQPTALHNMHPQYPLMLDMRVIFADISAGLRDLPSVETEGSAWLLSIRVAKCR